MSQKKAPTRVYLDWAAATPLLPEAKAAMEPFLGAAFGNPSSVHKEGQRARQAVEAARGKIAAALEVRPTSITFTAGGTEANNLALFGAIAAERAAGRAYKDMEVITTHLEHPSITNAVEQLASLGVQVHYVGVTETGQVTLAELRESLSPRTVLVALSYANSEIGTLQPISAIRRTVREAEKQYERTILLQLDAAQAPLWLTCQFAALGADLVVLDAAKCCGPKGVGILVHRSSIALAPVMFGGGQERGLRPGTENVAGIVGAGVALEQAQKHWQKRAEKISVIRDAGIEYLLQHVPGAVLNGPEGNERIANNINISIPGLDTEYATIVLDAKGFAVSTKSACASVGGGASAVVQAITGDSARAKATLRFTLGPDTTISDLRALADSLATHTTRMRHLTD